MGVARYYREDKNPEGAQFPGVPLRDIDDEEWNLFPEWLKQSVDASPFYQITKSGLPRKHKEETDE